MDGWIKKTNIPQHDASTSEVDAGGFGQLAASLSHAVSLTVLRLQACGLRPDNLEALGASLRCLPSVRHLDLSCNRSLTGGLSRLSSHLPHMAHLESLDLHLCRLKRFTSCLSPVQVLPSLTALTALDVSSNKEAGGAVHQLVSVLPLDVSFPPALVAPYLRSLDVSWCKVVGGRLPLLMDALQPSVVLELRLSSCGLTTDDLAADVCRRGCVSSLRVLDLSYNDSVGDAGWAALFAAGGLGSLEEADLSLRPLTSAPCSAWLPSLLGALPRMPALVRLAMQRWSAGPQEEQQLRFSMKNRNIRPAPPGGFPRCRCGSESGCYSEPRPRTAGRGY
uniref:Leucine rich repeat containing 31 n=1 Tax=Xiphophorus maculatus TaxID=8083 RepID=A0A3B5QCQ8_XIPMA